MSRMRLLLGLTTIAVLAGVAGCSAAGSIDMRPVNDSALADAASRSLQPVPDRPGRQTARRTVLQEAISNGTTTYTGLAPPIDQGLPFEVDGSYYNLTYSVVNTSSANRVSIQIDYNGSEPNGTAVKYSDLPAVDKEALQSLLPPKEVPPSEGFDLGVGVVYTDAELHRSVLAPDPSYNVVIYEGERYPILVEEPERVTVRTYRYQATEIASNASIYAQNLRRNYAFRLTNLSEDEQSIINEAIGEGAYYAESSDDSGFKSLLNRFRAREAITSDQASGLWLVRYEGELYLVDMQYGGFITE